MKARRPPGRFAALVGAPPADVLAATRRHLDAHSAALERAMRTAAAVTVTPDGTQDVQLTVDAAALSNN